MNSKIHTCFCGQSFESNYFRWHVRRCPIYKQEAPKVLTFDNFYQRYMVDHVPFAQFFKEEPYCHCSPRALEKLAKECNFPKLVATRQGSLMLVDELYDILNYDYLYDCYINKKMSCTEIAESVGNIVYPQTIMERIKKFGIQMRTIKEAMAVCDVQDKIKVAMRRSDVRKKLSIIARKKSTQDKRKRTCKLRYNYESSSQNPDIKAKIQASFERNNHAKNLPALLAMRGIQPANRCFSRIANKLFKQLCSLFPTLEENFRFATHPDERCLIVDGRAYYLDFCYDHDGIKFDIEFNGDYWHANPLLYTESHIMDVPDSPKGTTAKDIWNHDKQRIATIEAQGFKTMTVWEHDYRNEEVSVLKRCCEFIKEQLPEHNINDEKGLLHEDRFCSQLFDF